MKANTIAVRRTGAGHKALNGLFMLAAVIGLLAFVCPPASAAKRGLPYQKFYSLNLSVTFSYSTKGEKTSDLFKDNSSFTQRYTVGMKGYVLDPRLMLFGVKTSFRHYTHTAADLKDFSSVWVSLHASLLNRINKDRGLKLWKYIPSPILMNYSYSVSSQGTRTSFGFSTTYSRPGHIRMFGNGRFIFYDKDGERKLDANRYRVKYKKPDRRENLDNNWNGNWNRNGNGNWNGNWNRNGNGNWNGNWNRNGNGNWNGNWNRNGNGNWNGNWNGNGNGNGNWNGNGNGNGNWNGNWNRNGNGNWNGNINRNRNQNQDFNQNIFRDTEGIFQRRLSLFSFKFPNMRLGFNRSTSKSKDHSKSTSTFAEFTASAENLQKNRAGKTRYRSAYGLHYTYRQLDYSGLSYSRPVYRTSYSHIARLTTSNQWGRLSVSNSGMHRDVNGLTRDSVASSVSYVGVLMRRFNYSGSLAGRYARTDSASNFTYGYGFNIGTGSAWNKNVKLSPKLVSRTHANVRYSRSEGRNRPGSDSYGISVSESLVSTHFKRAVLRSRLTTGYAGPGGDVPLAFNISVNSRGLKRASLNMNYSFTTRYPLDDAGRTKKHLVDVNGRFIIKPHIILTSKIKHSITEVETKNTANYRYAATGVSSTLIWKITTVSTLSFRGNASFSNDDASYSASTRYSSRLFSTGSISLGASWSWNDQDGFDHASHRYTAAYGWSYGRLSFKSNYAYSIGPAGTTGNSLSFSVTRVFGRLFNRLY